MPKLDSLQPNQPIPNPPAGIRASLAAAHANAPALSTKLGGGNGDSLAEMAQRDLDAALQLLAYRAQYITGASGAAIALRREGRNDMLCRASTGSSAPELGALLSTEFGLSGESVRTRKLLHCDDAERDARVNRVACRQLGIASVVVNPVINDDEVLGVFELFSGKANAFGEHDLSSVQRLSEMVQTAVRLARAATLSPEQIHFPEIPPGANASAAENDSVAEEILDEEIFSDSGKELTNVMAAPPAEVTGADSTPLAANSALASQAAAASAGAAGTPAQPLGALAPSIPTAPAKKLFWSATLNPEASPEKPAEQDLSNVPPVLRALRKCEVCGFPISAGRVLCVECEEKKWRGQLKRPPAPLR